VSHSSDLHAVKDIADDAELRLARLIGTAAYAPGVRAVLEMTALRGWKRRTGDDKPREEGELLPRGVAGQRIDPLAKTTPLRSPRAAREVNVPPVDLDAVRKRRREP
jgi:hypothetical protein